MKQTSLILLALLLATATQVRSQITLEKTYTGLSLGLANTITYGDKYYAMDVANAQCKIYNLDHSIWKTINLSIPSGYYLYDIQYVTDHLFNSDNLIEMLYVSYNYNTTGQYYTYDTRVVNESGTQLLSLPGAGYNWITSVATAGTRLFTYIYDNSVSPYTVTTKVYSLAGELPTGLVTPDEPASMRVWPNPVSDHLHLEYTLPAGVSQASLHLRNASGQLIRSFEVDGRFSDLELDASNLPSGIYFWSLSSPGYRGTSRQIVINH